MMREFEASSFLYGGNAPFMEDLYEAWLDDPASVDPHWRAWFESLQPPTGLPDPSHRRIRDALATVIRAPESGPALRTVVEHERKQVAVLQMINAHRFLGVRNARLDPLARHAPPAVPELDPAHYGFTEADRDTTFNTGSLVGPDTASLGDILTALRQTYCGTIGLEYMHIPDVRQKRWIQERFERVQSRPALPVEQQRRVLEGVTHAETLERYLHARYTGQKRFSLEGGDSLIPLLRELVLAAGAQGLREIVIGMSHRGRLNVLVNVLGKTPADLFSEFEGRMQARRGTGDVKYHQGFSTDVATPGGPVHLTLGFNPSHLEIINPVIEGSVRARQHRRGDRSGAQVLSVLLHGDAAMAGQGVVMETLALSQTRGFGTGGTLHVVVNNQIGFTVSDQRDTRSSLYCTDVGKMIDAPVFHVNGDDPEAVVFCTQAALDFRNAYSRDVILDLVCFRRQGHNEQDEPMVTQPLMYKSIRQHPGTRQRYADQLVMKGTLPPEDPERMIADYRRCLDAGETIVPRVHTDFHASLAVDWAPYKGTTWDVPTATAVARADLERLAGRLTEVPPGFRLHAVVEKLVAGRSEMGRAERPLDWGMAENMAYASLLDAGTNVRLSGQDSGRGTFFHRHAVWHDQNRERWDEGVWVPLQNLRAGQGDFVVIDSLLSEEAVLAFEYGYAAASPNDLVIWEAQFGDFANGAQVVIDQFLSSSESKWGVLCSLVLFLPHGYEGQGPEHSSGRIERYLQLCAEDNLQVVIPSTPAQFFHLLRRQVVRPYRKPLVVFTPKSLLRHPESVSPLDELVAGAFQPVLSDPGSPAPEMVKRLVVCSGKLYFDLVAERRERAVGNLAIVRCEQLYPFPHADLAREMHRYAHAEVLWVQDEPENQGAWLWIRPLLEQHITLEQRLRVVARPAAAAPATGYIAQHKAELTRILEEVFAGL